MEGRGTRRTDVHRVVRLRSSVAVSDHGMNLEDAVSRGNGMHANRPVTALSSHVFIQRIPSDALDIMGMVLDLMYA